MHPAALVRSRAVLFALLLLPLPALAGDEAAPDPAEEAADDTEPAAGEASDEIPAATDDAVAEPEPEPEPEPVAEPVPEPEPAPVVEAPPPVEPKPALPPVLFALSAQERVRFEAAPDWLFDGNPDAGWRIGNRARIGVKATWGPVAGFFQIQDVRFWGSEVNPASGNEGTLFDWVADGLDIHQAWAEVVSPYGLSFRVGRQEINWHGQRLIGAVGWTHQARSFDAVRLELDREEVGAEVFYAKLLERPVNTTDVSSRGDDQHLLALRGGPRVGKALYLDGLAIFRFDDAVSERLVTAGVYAKGTGGPLYYEAEGYVQGGTRAGTDVLAYLFGGRIGVSLPDSAGLKIGGGADIVSGDGDPADGTIRGFDTLYATNHKFYGHIDRYLALPAHAANQGLFDGVVNFAVSPVKPLTVALDVHVFASPAATADKLHGAELDLSAHLVPVKPLKISAGLWVYVPGAWHQITDAKPEVAGYLQTDFTFQ